MSTHKAHIHTCIRPACMDGDGKAPRGMPVIFSWLNVQENKFLFCDTDLKLQRTIFGPLGEHPLHRCGSDLSQHGREIAFKCHLI